MFIDKGTLVRVICCDDTTYTGKIYKTVIQLCGDNNRPNVLVFISQDKRFIANDGDFGCAALCVDKIKSLQCVDELGSTIENVAKEREELDKKAYRKQRNSEKIRRYKERHNNEYEAQYMKVYQKWYTRIRRAKEKGQLSADKLKDCNDIFSNFTSESYEKRTDVRNGNISSEAFSKWINDFEIQINMLWTDKNPTSAVTDKKII